MNEELPAGAPLPESRGARRLGWALYLVAALLVLELAVIAIFGNGRVPFAAITYPKRQALAAFLAFAGGVFLRGAAWRSRGALLEFAGRMALLLFGLGFAYGVAEVGLRVYLWRVQSYQSLENIGRAENLTQERIKSATPLAAIVRRSADPLLLFELKPNLDMLFGHKRVRTNAIGLREDRDYPERRPPRSVRIVGLGDSGMFGWSVEQDEMYLAVLERNLNGRGDGVTYEVLNLGVPGYNTELEVQSLRDKGLRYSPDIVVVGWCDNDFSLPYFVMQEGQWTRRDVSLLYYLLFDRRQYAEIALSRVVDRREFDEERVPQRMRERVRQSGVRRAFQDLQALAAERGFKVLVFGPMQGEAVEICRSLGLPYYNTKERIPAGKYPKEWGVHFMHPRAEGHRVLGEQLEEELRRLGWLAPR